MIHFKYSFKIILLNTITTLIFIVNLLLWIETYWNSNAYIDFHQFLNFFRTFTYEITACYFKRKMKPLNFFVVKHTFMIKMEIYGIIDYLNFAYKCTVRNFCIKLPLHVMEVFFYWSILIFKYFHLIKYKLLYEF